MKEAPLSRPPVAPILEDPVLSTGRRRSAVLSAWVIARPNGRGRGPGRANGGGKKKKSASVFSRIIYDYGDPPPKPVLRPCWLYEAVHALNVERVEALLNCPGVRVDEPHAQETALVDVVRMLGQYREYSDLQKRCSEILDLLIKAGASVAAETKDGTPLLALVWDQPCWAARLMEAGASPAAGSRTTPLMEALRAGSEEAALKWLTLSRPSEDPLAPNPWSILMPHLRPPRAPVPYSWVKSRTTEVPPPLDHRMAWVWAHRLVAAGHSLDRPLQPWPTPKTPQEEREARQGYGSRFLKVDHNQNTPLVEACAFGCTDTVDRLLALGANPHAWAPNGTHPFMVWIAKVMGLRYLASPLTVEECTALQQGAERFWSPALATAQPPLWVGFSNYEFVHPLGALLAGPCLSSDERLLDLGWAWVDRLLAAGLACPLPVSDKDSSVIEHIVGNWVLALRMSDDRESGPFSDRFLGLLAALPGWREAQATPCSDQWRMVPQAIRSVARCWRHLMEEDIPLGTIAIAGGDWAAYMATGAHPLLELCTTGTYESSVDRDRPVPVAAVNFLLQQTFIHSEERQNALVALLAGPARSGTLEALACFEAAGCSVDALVAAHGPKMDAVLGREARASHQRLEEGLTSKVALARPRPRM